MKTVLELLEWCLEKKYSIKVDYIYRYYATERFGKLYFLYIEKPKIILKEK